MQRAFQIDMNGTNQNPDVVTTAKGTGIAIYDDNNTAGDPNDDTLVYIIDVLGVDWGPFTGKAAQTPANPNDNVVDAHFHQAESEVNGPIRLFWTGDSDFKVSEMKLIGGVPFAHIEGKWDATEAAGQSFVTFVSSFNDGALAIGDETDFYANIHSVAFGSGSIRGQLTLIAMTATTPSTAWPECATTSCSVSAARTRSTAATATTSCSARRATTSWRAAMTMTSYWAATAMIRRSARLATT
jgi:hypothetical protein